MKGRTTFTLFVIAVLLTLYAVLFEAHRPSGFEGAGKVFRGLEPSDILRLEVEYGGEDAASRTGAGSPLIAMERRGEHRWEIVEPIRFPGFLPRIEGLTWAVADLVQIDRIPEDSDAWAAAIPDAGPELTIRLRTRQGEDHTVEIGRDHPEPELEYVYIRVDGADVHVTRKRFREVFTLGLSDLRSRALFPIAPADAVYLSVRSGEGENDAADKELVRPDGSALWFFEGSPDLEGTLADRRKMEKLLVDLNSWQIERFENDAAEDLAPYGLDRPRLVVTGRHRNGRETVLEIGGAVRPEPSSGGGEDARVYVRHGGEPFVFSAESAPLESLETEAQELRTDHVFDFQAVEIDRVVASGPRGGFVLERTKPSEEGERRGSSGGTPSWSVRAIGEEDAHEADRRLIGVALAELRELLIQEFLPPLEPEERDALERSVTVTLETGEGYRIRFGERSGDARDRGFPVYHAVRSTDRSHFLVDTTWPERIDLGIWSVRNRAISRLRPESILELEVGDADSTWRIGLVNGEWLLPAEVRLRPGRELDAKLLEELLDALGQERFRVYRFAPDVPREEFDSLGVGRTSYRAAVSVLRVDGPGGRDRGFRRLFVGRKSRERKEGEPTLYYARADNDENLLLLTPEVPTLLRRLLDHLEDITGDS